MKTAEVKRFFKRIKDDLKKRTLEEFAKLARNKVCMNGVGSLRENFRDFTSFSVRKWHRKNALKYVITAMGVPSDPKKIFFLNKPPIVRCFSSSVLPKPTLLRCHFEFFTN